jgi:hypothetical protein
MSFTLTNDLNMQMESTPKHFLHKQSNLEHNGVASNQLLRSPVEKLEIETDKRCMKGNIFV